MEITLVHTNVVSTNVSVDKVCLSFRQNDESIFMQIPVLLESSRIEEL